MSADPFSRRASRFNAFIMRFTIKHVMICIAVLATLFALPYGCWVIAAVFSFWLVCWFAAHWIVEHGHRRLAATGFAIAAIPINVLYIAACLAPDSYVVLALGYAWPFLALPAIIGLGAPWAILSSRNVAPRRHASPAPGLIVYTMAFLPLVTLGSYWPLHLAFLLARPSLETLAHQVAAGRIVRYPQQVGPFRIVGAKADRGTGNVALLIDPDPNGPTGLVREQSGAPAAFPRLIVGSDLDVELGDGWCYRVED